MYKRQILNRYTFNNQTDGERQQLVIQKSAPEVVDSDVLEPVAKKKRGGFFGLFSREKDVAPKVPEVVTTRVDSTHYFGVPRNGSGSGLTANPLEMNVEWEMDDSATVGSALNELAKWIGYELTDEVGTGVMTRKLPTIQRKVASISVADGFRVVSGQGLMTVFDHMERTVRHVSVQQQSSGVRTPCPPDVSLASSVSSGVLLLPDGSECTY